MILLRLLPACLLLLALASPTGAGPAQPPAAPAFATEKLRVVLDGPIGDLDPHSTSSGRDVGVLDMMYETLVRPSTTQPLEWEPCLATEWTVNEEATEYTYTIRKDVSFHDGNRLDAQAVVRSLRRARGDDVPSAPFMAPYSAFLKHLETIEAADDNTVTIKLSRPDPELNYTLALHACMIVSPDTLDDLKELSPARRREALTNRSAGTGPFLLEHYDPRTEDSATVKAHSDYWSGPPKSGSIEFSWEFEQRTREKRVQEGDADLALLSDPGRLPELRKDASLKLQELPTHHLTYLSMNCDEDAARATADARVREAIALAINRQAICEMIGESAVPHHTLVPRGSYAFADWKPENDRLPRDEALKKAKKLIGDAGVQGGLDLLIPDIPRPYLTAPTQVANEIIRQLEAIGLTVEVEPVPMSEVTRRVEGGEYDLFLLGWMTDLGRPDDFWRPLLGGKDGKPSALNTARFYDEDINAQMDEARVETDVDKRKYLYLELEKKVFGEHRPMVPLMTVKRHAVMRADLVDIEFDAAGSPRMLQARLK